MIKQKSSSPMGQNIRRLRLAKSLTQADLADKMFVTQAAVARWESGDVLPCKKYWPGIAKALGCSVEELHRAAN